MDKPEHLPSARVSRHTMVIRKRAQEDAKRHGVESGRLHAVNDAAADNARRPVSEVRRDGHVVSGRFVSRREDGARTSVRLKSGDTLIRYRDGEALIRRTVPSKAEARNQILFAYGIGYAVLFVFYLVFLMTGTFEMTPQQYLDKAFARRHADSEPALKRAAMEVMRGNRTPAEVRFAAPISFYDANKDLIKVEAGNRITLQAAAKLGNAIIEDMARPESNRTFSSPFVLYKERRLAEVDWGYWLLFYNLLGFICCLFCFCGSRSVIFSAPRA